MTSRIRSLQAGISRLCGHLGCGHGLPSRIRSLQAGISSWIALTMKVIYIRLGYEASKLAYLGLTLHALSDLHRRRQTRALYTRSTQTYRYVVLK